jgi:hypothetical protein
MKLDAQEQKSGMTWFVVVGVIAIGFSAWLANRDYALSTSPREQVLHDTLEELRTAQFTLNSRVTDDRQGMGATAFQAKDAQPKESRAPKAAPAAPSAE